VKFDYKPTASQMGSPIFRRTLHVSLGFTAFVCLVFALSLGKSRSPSRPLATVASEMPIALAQPKPLVTLTKVPQLPPPSGRGRKP